jgi:hypothetical protein
MPLVPLKRPAPAMVTLRFELELTSNELLEFESLFEDADSFTDYRLSEIGNAIKGFRDCWQLWKRKRFVAWFFLKGLSDK